jgi:hypothetical protein
MYQSRGFLLHPGHTIAPSPKGKCKSLHAGIEKFDRKVMILNGPALPHQLVEPLRGDNTHATRIRVHAMRTARRMTIDGHTKTHRTPIRPRPQHQMQVTRMEAVGD